MDSSGNAFDRTVLSTLIVFEALLFVTFYSREIAWYPPLAFDQTVFLTETYSLQERVLSRGLGQLWEAIWIRHSSGIATPIEGAIAGLVLGGTRLPQLCVLFLFFVVLQIVVFYTARAVWNGRAFGYLALGLILAQGTPWCWAGGLFDFRLDFFAYCLYGIWACAVIRSKIFLERRWAIASGLVGALLVLHRFITIIYLLGVCGGFALACAVLNLWFRNSDITSRLKQRLRNLTLSSGIVVLLVSPILFINRTSIHDYYVVGHASGQEKYIRAAEFGITDLTGHLLYYPKSILNDHLGLTFLWSSAIAIVCSLVARRIGKSRRLARRPASGGDKTVLLQFIFLLGAILGPIVVLTIDISKSPVVGGIVGAPVALLVVALAAACLPQSGEDEVALVRRLRPVCAVTIFTLGLLSELQHLTTHLPQYAQRQDLVRLAELDNWLVNYATDQNWTKPTISFDVISDWLNATAMTASGYEQSRKLIQFQTMLGASIFGVPQTSAISMMAKSDFVMLTTSQRSSPYPFDQQIAQYRGDLKNWADANMVAIHETPFEGFTATIYTRPNAILSGLSGGWVTSKGLSIESLRRHLQRYPEIRLSGSANYSWLPKLPNVSATIEMTDTSEVVPASFRRTPAGYEILIDLSSSELPSSDPVHLHLSFDTFFVPQKIGLNDDNRELVIPAPSLVELVRRKP